MIRRLLRGAALACWALALAALLAGPAGAHSSLTEASPRPAERLTELSVIELTFGSPLLDDGTARISLTPSGETTELAVGPTQVSDDGLVLRARVLEDLSPGLYVVRYLAVSVDTDLNDGGYEIEFVGSGTGASGLVWYLAGAGLAAWALVAFIRPTAAASDDEAGLDRTVA